MGDPAADITGPRGPVPAQSRTAQSRTAQSRTVRSRTARWARAAAAATVVGGATLAAVEALLLAVGADAWVVPRTRWHRGLAGWQWSSPRSVGLGAVLAVVGAAVLLRSRPTATRAVPTDAADRSLTGPLQRASAPGVGLWVPRRSVEAHLSGVLRTDPDIAAASVRVGRWRTVARVQARPGVEDHAGVGRRASRDADAALDALGVEVPPLRLRLVPAGRGGPRAGPGPAGPVTGRVAVSVAGAVALAAGVRLLVGAAGLEGTEPGARYRDLAATLDGHPAWWAMAGAAAAVAVAVVTVVTVAGTPVTGTPVIGTPVIGIPAIGIPAIGTGGRTARRGRPGAEAQVTTATLRGTTVVATPALRSAWRAEMATLPGVRALAVEPIDRGADGYALRARVAVADAEALDRVRRALPGATTRLGRVVGGAPVGIDVIAELAPPPPALIDVPARAGDAAGR